MPSAMIGRIAVNAAGLPVSEYLHRAETLFVEPEWSWVSNKDLAFIFPSTETAEAEKGIRCDDSEPKAYVFVIICAQPDAAARERREEDRIAGALADAPKPVVSEAPELRGVSVAEMTKADHHGRRRAARANCEVAGERKRQKEAAADKAVPTSEARGADRWKQVFATRVKEAHRSPDEVYAETCRHLGEHEEDGE